MREQFENPMVQLRYAYAIDLIKGRLRLINADLAEQNSRPIIRNMTSRIKTPESVCKKLAKKGLEETFEKTIPSIFAEEGEAGFREKETQILKELGKCSGLVIATGGGCVTRTHNHAVLHQNGTCFWLQRNTDVLPTDGRPLSKAGQLSEMYTIRKPMYEAFADHRIDNNGTPAAAVEQILALWEGKP